MTDVHAQPGPAAREARHTARQTASRPLRCAIYTRKSTENGLEQEFNSLDNQREAAEAYIKSQAHEGWSLLPGAYDDGGFSGGSLDRPALQRLLVEVKAGRVDVILVYKVDRLTRSLSDFAKLVDLFDAHGVSFVSVTQAFNTTTSMGRLTLNVLLSFAQFEREVTAERIRDKVAASKRKGMRMGGPVPLGYAVRDKKLIPHPEEAETVRLIFRRYLDQGCLSALMQDLAQRGIVSKLSRRRDGSTRGGLPFSKGPLAFLLRNRTYAGEVIHKGKHFTGEHESIVPAELFHAVQQALDARAHRAGIAALNGDALLKGLLFDERGKPMISGMAKKNGARYRYYVSSSPAQGRADADPVVRVSAPEIEAVVLQTLGVDRAVGTPEDPREDARPALSAAESLRTQVERIVLREGSIEITQSRREGEAPLAPTILPWTIRRSRRRRKIIGTSEGAPVRPIRAETRARLIDGIANARLWLDELASGRVTDTRAIAVRQGCSERHVRMTLNLAFLSPAIVKAAINGTLPDGPGVVRMTELQGCWGEQMTACTAGV